MKKLILLCTVLAVGFSVHAQSKSEIQEQLNSTIQQLQLMRKSDSLQRLQLQAEIEQLKSQLASQESVVRSYALQVSAMSKQIEELTSSNGKVYIVEGTNATSRFTVPKGKVWQIMSVTREPDAKVEGGTCTCYVEVFTRDGIKLGPYTRSINDNAKNPLVLTEGMSFRIFLGYFDKATSSFVSAPDVFKGYVSYTEYNN